MSFIEVMRVIHVDHVVMYIRHMLLRYVSIEYMISNFKHQCYESVMLPISW